MKTLSVLIVLFLVITVSVMRDSTAGSTTDIQVFIESNEFKTFHIANNRCAQKVNESVYLGTEYSSSMYLACMADAYQRMTKHAFEKTQSTHDRSEKQL